MKKYYLCSGLVSLMTFSIAGHRYRLLATDNLIETFVEVRDLLATGQTGTFSVPLGNREFFRVEDLGVPTIE